ncbi:MAG: hypothetical protein U9P72_03735 [Campylobacterota bacterium]|nr:hypothetical protein [Campylobacterota bacterium]
MIKKIIVTTALVATTYASSCWSTLEVANFAQDEFSEKTRFSIRDAVTCEAISNAKFFIGNVGFEADKYGIVTVPLPPEDMDMNLPITIKKDRYITANEEVMVVFGSYWNNLFLMSKKLPSSSARFVLSWGERPSDLDLHLKANSYHVSFRNKKSVTNRAKLDRDSMKGYGPETITINKLNKHDSYRVLVNRFSKKGTINDKAQMRVYLDNKIDRVIRLKNTTAKCIELATITDNIISYNQRDLSDSECK